MSCLQSDEVCHSRITDQRLRGSPAASFYPVFVKVGSGSNDFVVCSTTCSTVFSVIILITLWFPPSFQTSSKSLSFFSAVRQPPIYQTWGCHFLTYLEWAVLVEDVNYNRIKLISKLIGCRCDSVPIHLAHSAWTDRWNVSSVANNFCCHFVASALLWRHRIACVVFLRVVMPDFYIDNNHPLWWWTQAYWRRRIYSAVLIRNPRHWR